MIGKIQRVPLREVWKHEALELTPWLQDNLDVINAITGLTLAQAEREQAAGSFSVDLVAEDESGRTVIIENQLERSDHDHLGKVLTYLVAFDAQVAVWIVSDPRPEHVSAINWLNESSAADFYLLKLEAIRIHDSPPAPLFTLIVGPSEEARQVGETKKEFAEKHKQRQLFWEQLLTRAESKTDLHRHASPSIDTMIYAANTGKRRVRYAYRIRHKTGLVALYIEREDAEENYNLFKQLKAHQSEIEAAFGHALIWDHRDGRRRCSIEYVIEKGGMLDADRWPQIQDSMIEVMIRLEGVLRPYVASL